MYIIYIVGIILLTYFDPSEGRNYKSHESSLFSVDNNNNEDISSHRVRRESSIMDFLSWVVGMGGTDGDHKMELDRAARRIVYPNDTRLANINKTSHASKLLNQEYYINKKNYYRQMELRRRFNKTVPDGCYVEEGAAVTAAPAANNTAPAGNNTAPAGSNTAPAGNNTAPAGSNATPAGNNTAPAPIPDPGTNTTSDPAAPSVRRKRQLEPTTPAAAAAPDLSSTAAAAVTPAPGAAAAPPAPGAAVTTAGTTLPTTTTQIPVHLVCPTKPPPTLMPTTVDQGNVTTVVAVAQGNVTTIVPTTELTTPKQV